MKTILVVEDEKAIRQNIVKILSHSGFQALHAVDGTEGINKAKAYNPDLIICDIMMPGCDGYEVLQALRNDPSTHSIPFIFLSAKVDKPDVRQGMNLGADDYLTKPFTSAELIETVNARFNRQDVMVRPYQQEMKRAAENLNHLAFYDAVTDLPNLILLHQRLQEQINHVKTTVSSSIAVLRIYFLHEDRAENLKCSTLSDSLLRAIALRLKAFAQRVDSGQSTAESWSARLGGQEFALVLTNILVTEDVLSFLRELVTDLQVPYDLDYQSKRLLVKVGATLYPDHGKTASQLLSHAEIAVHHCLLEDQTPYCLYMSEMKDAYTKRQQLFTDLPFAWERNEFHLVYQPQVHWVTERITGVEALLRWNHPELGEISPNQFMSIAEDAQFLPVLGKWVIERACQQMMKWRSLTLLPLQVSINIWPQQLQDATFLDHILQCLRQTHLKADQLILDINEPCLMALDFADVSRLLRELSKIGIQIAIDSFGMHSMPLQNLKRLPISILKLDKSFVDHIVDDKRDAIITEAIIAMAQSLKLKVVAKGIETEEQRTVITKYGCHLMQGYLYSPPLPPDELEKLLMLGNADVVG